MPPAPPAPDTSANLRRKPTPNDRRQSNPRPTSPISALSLSHTPQILGPDGTTDVSQVKKRYSEFEALHTNFAKRYDGMAIPPLPTKDSGATTEANRFKLNRMRGLTLFCQAVMMNNFLRNDKGWLDFLTPGMSCQTDEDFDVSMRMRMWMRMRISNPDARALTCTCTRMYV